MNRAILPPLSVAFLQLSEREGRLPLDCGALTLPEAAGLAATMPPVGPMDARGCPRGWGLLPPRGAEPTVIFGRRVVDEYGEPVRRGAEGSLGCMWATPTSESSGLPMFRVWLRSEPGRGVQAEFGLWYRQVDCYSDCIGQIRAIGDEVPRLTGWQVCRLDGAGGVR